MIFPLTQSIQHLKIIISLTRASHTNSSDFVIQDPATVVEMDAVTEVAMHFQIKSQENITASSDINLRVLVSRKWLNLLWKP